MLPIIDVSLSKWRSFHAFRHQIEIVSEWECSLWSCALHLLSFTFRFQLAVRLRMGEMRLAWYAGVSVSATPNAKVREL